MDSCEHSGDLSKPLHFVPCEENRVTEGAVLPFDFVYTGPTGRMCWEHVIPDSPYIGQDVSSFMEVVRMPTLPRNPGPRGAETLVVEAEPVQTDFTEQEKAWIVSRQVGKSVRTGWTNQEKAEGVARMLTSLLSADESAFIKCLRKRTPMPDVPGSNVILLGGKQSYISPFSLVNNVLLLTTGHMVYYGVDDHDRPAFLVAPGS
jgi:hypothetical protein